MKLIQSLLAVSVVAVAGQAQATCYSTTGSLTAISTVGATSTPSLYVHAGTTSYSTSASVYPTFTGNICIDTSVSPATVTGVYADFVQYSTSVRVLGFITAVVNQPNLVYSFNGGTTAWAPNSPGSAEGTLTLGQALTMTGGNGQTSDATLLFDTSNGATAGSCSGSSIICNGQSTWFLAYPDMERFFMTVTITYNAVLGKYTISGTAVGADTGGSVTGGTTGNTWYSHSFTGTEI